MELIKQTVEEIHREDFEERFADRGVIGDRTFKDYCTGLYEDIIEWHIANLHHSHTEEVEQARREERERCIEEAWKYCVKMFREESGGKRDLIEALTPNTHSS